MLGSVLLVLAAVATGDAPAKSVVRYVKPQGDRFVLESEITRTTGPDGATYVSRTVRGNETMVLTVERSQRGKLVRAGIEHTVGGDRKTAAAEWKGDKLVVTRGGISELLDMAEGPVVTTAPDWSDILELVRRYDAAKGGKQEFAGLWFHPTRPTLKPAFTTERVGEDTVRVEGKDVRLSRFKITLRSGGYTVWAGPDGTTVKILANGPKAVPVILEGYEEATMGLK